MNETSGTVATREAAAQPLSSCLFAQPCGAQPSANSGHERNLALKVVKAAEAAVLVRDSAAFVPRRACIKTWCCSGRVQ